MISGLLRINRLRRTTTRSHARLAQLHQQQTTFRPRSLSTTPSSSQEQQQQILFDPLIPLKILNPVGKKNSTDPPNTPLPHLDQLENESFATKVYGIMLGLPM